MFGIYGESLGTLGLCLLFLSALVSVAALLYWKIQKGTEEKPGKLQAALLRDYGKECCRRIPSKKLPDNSAEIENEVSP